MDSKFLMFSILWLNKAFTPIYDLILLSIHDLCLDMLTGS